MGTTIPRIPGQRLALFSLIYLVKIINGLNCPEGKVEINNVCTCTPGSLQTKANPDCSDPEKVNAEYLRAKQRKACMNRGYLSENIAQTTCECDEGWKGERCEIAQCKNHGLSITETATCDCLTGFKGILCEDHECNKGVWNKATEECNCKENWTGPHCKYPKCFNEGTVREPTGNGKLATCRCSELFYGTHCKNTYCLHGNVTEDLKKCVCSEMWEGDLCTNPKCVHGKREGWYQDKCECDGKWTGKHCNICRHSMYEGYCCPYGKYGTYCSQSRSDDGYDGETSRDRSEKQNKWVLAVGVGIAAVGVAACICCVLALAKHGAHKRPPPLNEEGGNPESRDARLPIAPPPVRPPYPPRGASPVEEAIPLNPSAPIKGDLPPSYHDVVGS